MDGDFTVIYFIGPFDDADPSKWQKEPTLAGINHVFVGSVKACANCKRQAEASDLSSSTTPITPILMDYIDCKPKDGQTEPTGTKGLALQSMEPAHVTEFLKKNLRWRVVKVRLKFLFVGKGEFADTFSGTEYG